MAPKNRAIVAAAPGEAKILERPYPALPADDYIIVKPTAVAINPTDAKHVQGADKMNCIGTHVGCDYAGIVVEVGPGVSKSFKKGDRICGPVNGCNAVRKSDGSFATYTAVKGDLQIIIPDNITDEEAATLGIAVTTIGQGLYQTLQLPLPTSPAKEPLAILIYGGSTAMGITAIQYAKLSGLTVVTTSSPHNFDYLKSLGADAVFDYKSPSAVDDIRAFTSGNLSLAYDCQATPETAAFCARAIGAAGGRYVSLLGGIKDAIEEVNPKISVVTTLYYNVFGEPYYYRTGQMDAVPENYEFGKTFWELSRGLLADGKLKPIRIIKNRGGSGLEGVLVGLDEVNNGNVSGGKLVYTL